MYTKFYGLHEEPFNLTPNPKFLHLSKSHREGLAHLLYGIERKKSPIVLTGYMGTGKTTLLYSLLERMDKSTHIAFLVNSQLNFVELLQHMLYEFGLDMHAKSKGALLIELKKFLKNCEALQENVIVILDEAQNFSADILEELRLLTNLESSREKLVQIILVGQLGLEEKLRLPELAQFRQRIDVNYRLLPISYHEVQDYIATRLAVAGATQPLFTPEAVEAVYTFSKGIPRVINVMCDLALFFGCTGNKPEIGRTIMQQVQESLNLPEPVAPPNARFGLEHTHARMDASIIQQARGTLTPRDPTAGERGRARRRATARVVGVALVSLLCGALAWEYRANLGAPLARWSHAFPPPFMREPSPPPAREPSSAARGSRTPQEITAPRSNHPSDAIATPGSKAVERPGTASLSPTSQPDLGLRQRGAAETREAPEAPQSVIVQPGETWATILRRAYGRDNSKIRRRVLQANPGLSARARLEVGQRITLPPVPQMTPQQ